MGSTGFYWNNDRAASDGSCHVVVGASGGPRSVFVAGKWNRPQPHWKWILLALAAGAAAMTVICLLWKRSHQKR